MDNASSIDEQWKELGDEQKWVFQGLCDLYSSATSSANRIWLVSVSATLIAFAFDSDFSIPPAYAGVALDRDRSLICLSIALSLCNLVFLVRLSAVYRVRRVFFDFLAENHFEKYRISDGFALKDFAHWRVKPSFNQIYPIVSTLTGAPERAMNSLKPYVDAFYLCIPGVGVAISLVGIFTITEPSLAEKIIISLATVFAIVTLFLSAAFVREVRRVRSGRHFAG